MKIKSLIIGICLSLSICQSWACTAIIVSGKATADGRPLMWKHRDTSAPLNHMAYSNSTGYSFLALVGNNEPNAPIWAGSNETGFSIMNTASFNLKDDDVKDMDQEGALMRRALIVCKTIKDFENFLDTLSRPMRVEANFGVIDAFGGAAYYETNNEKYFKKDVNDEKLAPKGYIIYTNFSNEGKKDKGLGYIRFDNATKIFKDMESVGFTSQRIMELASRSFYNSQLGIDLKKDEDSPNKATGWFVEQDMIPRKESTAAIVIQGVKPGTNPEHTILWTALGYPPTAVTLPLWVKMGENQPALVSYNNQYKTAPLCQYAAELRDKVYSNTRGNGQKYLNWKLLWNATGTGYMQELQKTENEIFNLFNARKNSIEKSELDIQEIAKFYKDAELLIENAYKSLK